MIEVFFSYVHEDEKLRNKLEKQLSLLKQQGHISIWHDRKIDAGKDWKVEINAHLHQAQIILLLISPDFMASDYYNCLEVKEALKRHEAGIARVIPVILRPVYWEDASFGNLLSLPTGAKPVTLWRNMDEAFLDIAKGIRNVVKDLSATHKNPLQKTKQQLLEEGEKLYSLSRYEEALAAFEQAIQLDPTFAAAYNNKGNLLYSLSRYEEALAAFEQAIQLDPTFAAAHNNKGIVLQSLKSYEKALAAFDQAIQLNPNFAAAYNNKGNVFYELRRYANALTAFEQAVQLDSNLAAASNSKDEILHNLRLLIRIPRHFILQEGDNIPLDYLLIKWDENKSIAIRPESYESLQIFLDDLYLSYAYQDYQAYTYGLRWILVSKSAHNLHQHVIAPWQWLLKSKKNKPLHFSTPQWANLPPETYGLNAGTFWQKVDLPLAVFGVASNDPFFIEDVHSLSVSRSAVKNLNIFLNKTPIRVVPPENFPIEDYRYVAVFTAPPLEYVDRLIIL
jgi:tetratricopeptide (TPR) repeat protein